MTPSHCAQIILHQVDELPLEVLFKLERLFEESTWVDFEDKRGSSAEEVDLTKVSQHRDFCVYVLTTDVGYFLDRLYLSSLRRLVQRSSPSSQSHFPRTGIQVVPTLANHFFATNSCARNHRNYYSPEESSKCAVGVSPSLCR